MKKGLLIDDDALYLRALQRSLERRGHAIETATNPAQAIEHAAAQKPDYALVDLKLAEQNGLDLIAPLRQAQVDGSSGHRYASVATAGSDKAWRGSLLPSNHDRGDPARHKTGERRAAEAETTMSH